MDRLVCKTSQSSLEHFLGWWYKPDYSPAAVLAIWLYYVALLISSFLNIEKCQYSCSTNEPHWNANVTSRTCPVEFISTLSKLYRKQTRRRPKPKLSFAGSLPGTLNFPFLRNLSGMRRSGSGNSFGSWHNALKLSIKFKFRSKAITGHRTKRWGEWWSPLVCDIPCKHRLEWLNEIHL